MDFTLNEYEINLKKRYEEIFSDPENVPTWAFKKIEKEGYIHPAIPLVGNNYGKGFPKILIYASAENLCYLLNEKNHWLNNNEMAILRRRRTFEDTKNRFCPGVHIAPIEDGKLLLAIYHAALKMNFTGIENIKTPVDFYNVLVVDNYCKYAIYPDEKSIKKNKAKNKDYASKRELLTFSHEYIRADLKILQPDYLVLPNSIYNSQKEFIKKIVSEVSEMNNKNYELNIIPIWQMNIRNINFQIAPRKYDPISMTETEIKWYEKMKPRPGINYEKYVFGYIEKVLAKNMEKLSSESTH